MFCIQFCEVCLFMQNAINDIYIVVLRHNMYRKFNDTIFWHEKSILIVRVSKSTSCRLLKKTENVMFIFMSNLIMVQYFGSFNLINTRVSDNYSMTLTFEKNAWSSATYQKGTLKHSIILKIHALID